jgi:hypothetical protein
MSEIIKGALLFGGMAQVRGPIDVVVTPDRLIVRCVAAGTGDVWEMVADLSPAVATALQEAAVRAEQFTAARTEVAP